MSGLPRGWVRANLLEATKLTGFSINPSHFADERFTLYSVPSFDSRAPEDVRGIEIGSNKQIVSNGTLLVCKINPRINRIWIVGIHSTRILASTEWIALEVAPQVEPKYISFYLQNEHVRRYLAENASGVGGSLMRVRPAVLGSLSLPVPPLLEQRRIVAEIEKQFTRLDEAIRILRSALAKLKRARGTVFAILVNGAALEPQSQNGRESDFDTNLATAPRKALPDRTIALSNPCSWETASLDQLTTKITSGSRDWSPYYGRGTGTFLLAQNVKTRKLDLTVRQSVDPPANDASRERSAVQRGDLLVTIVGANTGDICAVNEELSEHYVCQSVALMRPLVPELTSYLAFYLSDEHFGRRVWKQYTYGAGRPHLSFEQLKKTPVLLPPVDLIPELTSEMQALESVMESSQTSVLRALAHAARLRRSILAKAFSGQLVSQDSNDEPASMLLERIRVERGASTRQAVRRKRTATPEELTTVEA